MSNLELSLRKRLEAEGKTIKKLLVLYDIYDSGDVGRIQDERGLGKWVSVERALAIFHESFEGFVVVPRLVDEVEAVIWATCEEGSLGRERMRELRKVLGL